MVYQIYCIQLNAIYLVYHSDSGAANIIKMSHLMFHLSSASITITSPPVLIKERSDIEYDRYQCSYLVQGGPKQTRTANADQIWPNWVIPGDNQNIPIRLSGFWLTGIFLNNGQITIVIIRHIVHVRNKIQMACPPPRGGGGGMSNWGLYIIRVNHFLKSTLHHPGAYASRPPTQEWKGPGTRQHPSRVSYPLRPKMSWMAQVFFYSNCLLNMTVPKIWRKATVIVIPKPNKPTDDPKNYRPISLLCVPFKLPGKTPPSSIGTYHRPTAA